MPSKAGSAESATQPFVVPARKARVRSIPNIPFVEFYLVFPQQTAVLLLKRLRAMVFFLALDIAHQFLQLA
jgi:hypothetical protein